MLTKEDIKYLIRIVQQYSCLSCQKLIDDYPIFRNFTLDVSFDNLLYRLNEELHKLNYWEENWKLLQQLKNKVDNLTSDRFSEKIDELKEDYPILGEEEFKECKTPEDYLKKLNYELEKLNKESSQKKKRTTSLHR